MRAEKRPQLWVGVDPGDRWVGVAMLTRTTAFHAVSAAVFDRTDDPWAVLDVLKQEFDGSPRTQLVIEKYRVRPVSFNRFSDAPTAQLVGAMKYLAAKSHRVEVFEVHPDAANKLALLPISVPIGEWRTSWPPSPHWEHALSAWRVLGHHLLIEDPVLLGKLSRRRRLKSVPSFLGGAVEAPSELWRLR